VDAVAERIVGLVLGVGQCLAELGVAHPAVGLGGPLSFGPGRVEVAQVLGVQPLAALIVSAVRLGGSHGAAPQKILWKTVSHRKILLIPLVFLLFFFAQYERD